MIPLRILVKNFRGLAEADLDLSAISLAGIAAPNGTGKSSLLTYAPLYALFGKVPKGSIDDLVKAGTQDMFDQFDFEHQGDIYQIIRTRSLKGKGKSTCEFQKLVNGRYESLSGATISETEKKIQNLLNLDANTFVSSSMILQGDSANFSQKAPGERKAILTQILGLSIYDQLQAAAREREKVLIIQLETSKNKLADLEEKLQTLPEVEQQMTDVMASITLNSLDIRVAENNLAGQQSFIKELESKENEAKEINRQMDSICSDISSITTEISDLNSKIGHAEIILEAEPNILAKVAELEEVKAKIPALQAKEDRAVQLKVDGKKLTNEGLLLIAERDELRRKIERLELDLSAKDMLERDSQGYQQGLIDLKEQDEVARQDQELRDQVMALERETDLAGDNIREMKSWITIDQNEVNSCQKKAEILLNSGCIDSVNAQCKFLQDAQEAKAKIPTFQAEIADYEEQIAKINETNNPKIEQVAELEKQREGKYSSERHYDLKQQVESIRLKAEAYAQLAGKEELLQNLNGQRSANLIRTVAIDEDVDRIKQEIRKLQQETENLPILKASIPTLEKYVAMKDKLPEARTTIQLSQEAIKKLQTEIEQKNEQHIQLLADYTSLSTEFAGLLPDAREKVETISAGLKTLTIHQNNLYVDQGTIRANLAALNKASEEKDKLSADLAPKAKELVRWQLLVKAFGKNGVPALIIENAIPELERISNDILSQMSNGAHSLRFETQRDLKSKDGVAETLDIIVSDWAGSRPYETYSGGEQLRIDLAIRFALAELLANRAGSKVEFITADEIFSSQDTEHRELVIEAIKAVSNRFRMILVISHIAEAQAAFDQQIVLSEGGQVEVIFN